MNTKDRRLGVNDVLRERINRLHDLHVQLHELSSEAFEELLEQVRGGSVEQSSQVLNDMIRKYVERLHTHRLHIEQEFFALTKGGLLSDEELAALLGPPVKPDQPGST